MGADEVIALLDDIAGIKEKDDISHLWNAFQHVQDWFIQRGNEAEAVAMKLSGHKTRSVFDR